MTAAWPTGNTDVTAEHELQSAGSSDQERLAEDGSIGYPAWQFANGHTWDSLMASYRVLSETGSEWSAASWCVTPHSELEMSSPIQWLATGRSGDVLARVAERDARRLAE